MTQSPILTLGERIGITADERVCISYYNDGQPWTSLHVPLRLADTLSASLTDKGMNVYFMVNQTVENMSSARGSITDITKLRAVWADLDIKAGGLPTMEAATNVIEMLSGIINCRPTVTVMSGHGLQPYWEVEDGEINDANRQFIAGVLKRWGLLVQRLCEIEGGKADSVYDLPRVLRAPGSINQKDPTNPVPTSMEIDEWTHPVSLAEIVEAVEAYGFINANVTVTDFTVLSDPSTWEPADLDCVWSQTVANQIANGNPDARHPWLLAMAVKIEAAARYGCITEDTYGGLVGLLESKFHDLLAQGSQPRVPAVGEVNTAFKWARARVASFSDLKLRDNVDYHSHTHEAVAVPDLPFASGEQPTTTAGASTPASTSDTPAERKLAPIALDDQVFSYTDTGNAERLAGMALGRFIYVPGLGWHVWDNGRYIKDESGSILQLAIKSVRGAANADPSKGGMVWWQKSMSRGMLASAVSIAETIPELVVPTTQLDCEGLLLCTPGGIVNLATGGLRPAVPSADFNTRQTAYTPAFTPMPQFERFLMQVLGDDPNEAEERIDYVQRLFGVALIGELRWQILPIFAGVGANGKSALLEIMGNVLGSYAAVMPENFLLESGKQEHSTEIMRLRGIRLAIGGESRPDGKFNESRVKMLTGEGVLSARAMRQDFVDFVATHTLFLSLNHPPQVRSGGDGFWRRIRKIDFRYVVPPSERDPGFPKRVSEEEGPAILQWAIEGAQKVLQSGLKDPISVEMSTLGYRAEEDHIDLFLQDCTAPSPESGFTVTNLYSAYMGWCRRNGELPITSVAMMRDLKTRMNLKPYRNKRERGYMGLLIFEDSYDRDHGQPPVTFTKNGSTDE